MKKKLREERDKIHSSLHDYAGPLEEYINLLQRLQQLTKKKKIRFNAGLNNVIVELY